MSDLKKPIIKRKLDAAIAICEDFARRFTEFKEDGQVEANCFSVYLATNEMCEYFPKMTSFAEKDVLCVTGSGDQALNAVYFGAKSVETFDVNHLAFLFYDLKQAALLNLNRQEFLDFYNPYNLFPQNYYDRISGALQPESKEFFDGLFAYANRTNHGKYGKTPGALVELIEEFRSIDSHLLDNNPYVVSATSYQETKERLKLLKNPIAHKYCPAHQISKNFQPKDIIILSNVMAFYLVKAYSKNSNLGATQVIDSVYKTLKSSGVVSLLYEYSCQSTVFDKRLRDELGINAQKICLKRDKFKPGSVYFATKEGLAEEVRDGRKSFEF